MLPASAAVIVALVAYKSMRTDDGSAMDDSARRTGMRRGAHSALPKGPNVPEGAASSTNRPRWTGPASLLLFEELDAQNKPVRLQTYLGRHRILLVFFDGKRGAEADPILARLKRVGDRLRREGVIVLAVGDARPVQNRRVMDNRGAYPFPLLSDVDDDTCRKWGRFDAARRRVRPAVFLIDRKGEVAWSAEGPVPLTAPNDTIDRLLGAPE